jgi:hypothetical protein
LLLLRRFLKGQNTVVMLRSFRCGLSGIDNALVFVIHFAAPKQIIQAADAIPTTAIPLDDQAISALLVGAAVIVGQEIDQQPSDCGGAP